LPQDQYIPEDNQDGCPVGAPFKIGRGDIVEEEVEGALKHLTVARLEMFTQIVFMGEKGINRSSFILSEGTPRRSSMAVLSYGGSSYSSKRSG
jgi:hypothetical protein